jgi:hypothetical protein
MCCVMCLIRENSVHMCLAHDAQKYGSGSSIISILERHGFLPTCRVMQLMLWMYATVEGGSLPHNFFVDVGEYCTMLPCVCIVCIIN